MLLTKKDLVTIIVVGALVGLLVQPVLSNNAEQISGFIGMGTARVAVFFVVLIGAPLALYVASLVGAFIPVIYQFAKFAAVGILNSMVDLGVFNIEYLLYGTKPTGIVFTIFKSLSFLLATTNSFVWNKFWTFGATDKVNAGETVKFYAVAIGGGFINISVATWLFNHPLDSFSVNLWGSVISPISGIVAAFLWDFLGYKYFVFKKA